MGAGAVLVAAQCWQDGGAIWMPTGDMALAWPRVVDPFHCLQCLHCLVYADDSAVLLFLFTPTPVAGTSA
jgi:hypothetical protein